MRRHTSPSSQLPVAGRRTEREGAGKGFLARRISVSVARGILTTGLILGFVVHASVALAITTAPTAFTLELNGLDFGRQDVIPEFSFVRSFSFEIDLFGSLAPGARFGNSNVEEVRYVVAGSLNITPPTPSGFPAFALNRFASGEGPISALDWNGQGSYLRFQITDAADLSNGLQLSELVPDQKFGTLLVIDGRERGRLDRARYHAPQLMLFPDGTGLLRSSDNSSEKTGTTNPGTGLEVNLQVGDEYITRILFDPSAITIVAAPNNLPVPEPSTAVLLGLGLAGLTVVRRNA